MLISTYFLSFPECPDPKTQSRPSATWAKLHQNYTSTQGPLLAGSSQRLNWKNGLTDAHSFERPTARKTDKSCNVSKSHRYSAKAAPLQNIQIKWPYLFKVQRTAKIKLYLSGCMFCWLNSIYSRRVISVKVGLAITLGEKAEYSARRRRRGSRGAGNIVSWHSWLSQGIALR